MKNINAQIWYDDNGQIIAVGYAPKRASKGTKAKQILQAVPLADQKQFILELKLSEKVIGRLHETHRVDVKNHTLIEERGEETET